MQIGNVSSSYSDPMRGKAADVFEALGGKQGPVPQGPGGASLASIAAARDVWSVPLWIVTHVDLHRTFKVQEFVRFLKDTADEVAPL